MVGGQSLPDSEVERAMLNALRSSRSAIRRLGTSAGVALLLLWPVLASGQDLDDLADEVERMRQDLATLQSHVYGDSYVATAGAGNLAADQEVRLQAFDMQLRRLTGQVEEVSFQVRQLSERLDKLATDVDFRLRSVEQGAVGLPAGAASAGASGAFEPLAGVPPASGQPQTLGVLSQSQFEAAQSGLAPPLVPPPPAPSESAALSGAFVQLPPGSPEEQYDYAFGLLRQANYVDAEAALRAFVRQNPNDRLAGNALYWLGETYYVRGNFAEAAVTFADGYQKYPASNKAPDNLLKLGMSLAQLGQLADACKTFAQLAKEFPTAPANVKERASRERQRYNCL